jgi:hypothetical protein
MAGAKRRTKAQRRAEATTRLTRAGKACSPYWAVRFRAGESSGPMPECRRCGRIVPAGYTTGSAGVCEDCRLGLWAEWVRGLRDAGIWPPKLHPYHDTGKTRIVREAVQAHLLVQVYDRLVATVGCHPNTTMSGPDLLTLYESVDRSLAAMERACAEWAEARRLAASLDADGSLSADGGRGVARPARA